MKRNCAPSFRFSSEKIVGIIFDAFAFQYLIQLRDLPRRLDKFVCIYKGNDRKLYIFRQQRKKWRDAIRSWIITNRGSADWPHLQQVRPELNSGLIEIATCPDLIKRYLSFPTHCDVDGAIYVPGKELVKLRCLFDYLSRIIPRKHKIYCRAIAVIHIKFRSAAVINCEKEHYDSCRIIIVRVELSISRVGNF